jgi:hypothetical protein
MWGTTNSKPPGRIIMIGQSETRSSSQIVFIYTIFCRCTRVSVPFTSHCTNCATVLSQNQFPELNTGIFWPFLFIQFYCPGSHTEYRWRCSYTNTPKQKTPITTVVSQTQFQRKQAKPNFNGSAAYGKAKPNFNENKLLIVERFCPLTASSNETIKIGNVCFMNFTKHELQTLYFACKALWTSFK